MVEVKLTRHIKVYIKTHYLCYVLYKCILLIFHYWITGQLTDKSQLTNMVEDKMAQHIEANIKTHRLRNLIFYRFSLLG